MFECLGKLYPKKICYFCNSAIAITVENSLYYIKIKLYKTIFMIFNCYVILYTVSTIYEKKYNEIYVILYEA